MDNVYNKPDAIPKNIYEANHYREVLAGPDGLQPMQMGIEVDDDGGLGFKDLSGTYKRILPVSDKSYIGAHFRLREVNPPEAPSGEVECWLEKTTDGGITWVKKHRWW